MNGKYFELICDKELDYIKELFDYLNLNMEEIMMFFNIDNISEKKKIIIWTDLDKYKNHIEKYYEYKDYMCADTNDGNINILSLEEAHKTIEHSDMTFDEMKKNIKHEFVHICQQECEEESIGYDIAWFWESLATNLGNPESFNEVDVSDVTIEQLSEFNNLDCGYPIAYTLGKYILTSYSHDEILEYVKYPKILEQEQCEILDNIKRNIIKSKKSI